MAANAVDVNRFGGIGVVSKPIACFGAVNYFSV